MLLKVNREDALALILIWQAQWNINDDLSVRVPVYTNITVKAS